MTNVTSASKSKPAPVGLEVIEPAYLALLREGGVPAWLAKVREAGAKRWRKEGLPSKRDERWKYTGTNFLGESNWIAAEVLEEEDLPGRELFPTYPGEASGEVVLLNGVLVDSWSSAMIPGVTITSAIHHGMEAAIDTGTGSVFEALNASFMHDVIAIEVAAGARVEKPLVLSQFALGEENLNEWSISCPRVVVKVGKGAEFALVELFGGEGRYAQVPVIEIELEDGARMSHARVSIEDENAVRFGSARVSVGRDAFCETYQFSLNGHLLREDLSVLLTAPGAEAVLDGLSVTSGKRHVDHATSVEHLSPNTTSSQLYKGLLADESRGVFSGRVKIHRDAQQSSAAQLNNTLLLSSKAEADTKPELEIDADDVKASHGATIGQLDPEHVFYLQARSIPREEAVKMLARGFVQDIAFRVKNRSMSEGLREIVDVVMSGESFEGALDGV